MYDAREKAIRDQQWVINASRAEAKLEGKMEGKLEGKLEGKMEGKLEGKIEERTGHIRSLQSIMQLPVSPESNLLAMSLEQLELLTADLQLRIRNRLSS